MPRMLGPKPIHIPPPLPWEQAVVRPSLVARLRALPRSRWVIMGLSVLVTAIIIFEFMIDSKMNMPKRVDTVILFQSWSAKRSAADIVADRQAEQAALEVQFAASRAYIATLPPAQAVKARKQYNEFATGLKPSQRPADYVAPVEPPVVAAATGQSGRATPGTGTSATVPSGGAKP